MLMGMKWLFAPVVKRSKNTLVFGTKEGENKGRGQNGKEAGRVAEKWKTLDFSRVLRVVVGDGFEPSNS